MRAVILAAGKGSRLGKASEGLPKCLLQIGGQPLILHQLGALADAGISPVHLVVGYAADLVREVVGNRAEYVMNARYETTNSLYSLLLAADSIKGPVLIMNSDDLFAPEVLEALLRAGEDSLAYDSTSGHAPEHMKVVVQGGFVKNLSKTLPKEEGHGENVGMILLSEKSAAAVFARAREIIDSGRTNAFLAEAIVAALRDISLRAVDIAGIPWTEIDTPYDLERARREIWPKIENRTGRRLSGWRQRRRRRFAVWSALSVALLVFVFTAGWIIAGSNPGPSWDTISTQGGKPVTVTLRGVPQRWWLAQQQEIVSTTVRGPQILRLDVRCLLAEGAKNIPFAYELLVDGDIRDVFKSKVDVSSKAFYGDLPVSGLTTLDLRVPDGPHTFGVRLAAGKAEGLLVRFRVVESPDEEEK